MSQLTMNRPAFVVAHPHLKPAHRVAQNALFGAAHTFGLKFKTPQERAAMIGGINELFALGIESRTELTVREMQALTVAIEAGGFEGDWRLTGDVCAEFDGEGNIDLLAGDGQPPRVLCRVCRERAQCYPLCDDNGDEVRGPGFCRECAPRPRLDAEIENEAHCHANYVLKLVLEAEHLAECVQELDRLSFRHSLAIQEMRAELNAEIEALQRHMDMIAGKGAF